MVLGVPILKHFRVYSVISAEICAVPFVIAAELCDVPFLFQFVLLWICLVTAVLFYFFSSFVMYSASYLCRVL